MYKMLLIISYDFDYNIIALIYNILMLLKYNAVHVINYLSISKYLL